MERCSEHGVFDERLKTIDAKQDIQIKKLEAIELKLNDRCERMAIIGEETRTNRSLLIWAWSAIGGAYAWLFYHLNK
jgi:hypothetical protein